MTLGSLRLIRPTNSILAGVGALLGYAMLPTGSYSATEAGLGFLAMAALAAGGNADNDIQDIRSDLLNRPNRPLSLGIISQKQAQWVAGICLALGCIAATLVSLAHGALALGMAVLLLAYNRVFKRKAIIGNILVAFLVALAPCFAEWPNFPTTAWPVAAFALLVHFAREIAKDIEDMPGDAAAGFKTWPLMAGERLPKRVAVGTLVLVLIVLPLPVQLLGYHLSYFLGAVPAGFLLLKSIRALGIGGQVGETVSDPARAQRWLKLAMLAGMAALFLGGSPMVFGLFQ